MAQISHIVNTINQMWMNERHANIDALGDETLQDMKKIRTNAAQNSSIMPKNAAWEREVIHFSNAEKTILKKCVKKAARESSLRLLVFRGLFRRATGQERVLPCGRWALQIRS